MKAFYVNYEILGDRHSFHSGVVLLDESSNLENIDSAIAEKVAEHHLVNTPKVHIINITPYETQYGDNFQLSVSNDKDGMDTKPSFQRVIGRSEWKNHPILLR